MIWLQVPDVRAEHARLAAAEPWGLLVVSVVLLARTSHFPVSASALISAAIAG